MGVLVVVLGLISTTEAAAARAHHAIPLHGHKKIELVRESFLNDVGTSPSNWVIYHCIHAWELSGDAWRWGDEIYSGGNRRACFSVAGDGVEVLWHDSTVGWENDFSDNETSLQLCGRLANFHQAGRPRPSGRILHELLKPLGGCR